MGEYYSGIFVSDEALAHYGVKGQKWGFRRFRNEDGSLTSEGRDHYGIGDPRKPGVAGSIRFNTRQQAEHNYHIRRFGSASAKTLESKPKQLSKKEQQIRKTRAKRLLKTAAIVGIGVAAIYGVHRYNKTTDNLIQLAKNDIHNTYKMGESSIKNAQDRANHNYWRTHDMNAITTRQAAKKVLHLNSHKQTRQFIKANNLAKRKTSEIIEQRAGKIVEQMHKNRRTGRFESISEKKRRKLAERMVRDRIYY